MLRLHDFSVPPEDEHVEQAEQDKLKRARTRLRYLDAKLEIIEQRGKPHVEPR